MLVQDASSESDDVSCLAVIQASAAAGNEDGDVRPRVEQKQTRRVTGKRLRGKAPTKPRKKQVCRGLVYESDQDENADIRKVSTASKKRSSRAHALPKVQLVTLPCTETRKGNKRLLGMEPVQKEPPIEASVLVEPSLVHDEPTNPFDAMESIDLFTSPEEDLPLTDHTGPPVNLDELFGF